MSGTPRTDALIASCVAMDADERDLVMRAGWRMLEQEITTLRERLAEREAEVGRYMMANNTLTERLATYENRLWSAIGGREAHWIEHADEDGKRRRDQMTLEGALVFLHGADQRAQQAEQRAERAEALAAQNAKDAERLDWLLWKLPGDAIRYCVGAISDTSDGTEFRAAIDAARKP